MDLRPLFSSAVTVVAAGLIGTALAFAPVSAGMPTDPATQCFSDDAQGPRRCAELIPQGARFAPLKPFATVKYQPLR